MSVIDDVKANRRSLNAEISSLLATPLPANPSAAGSANALIDAKIQERDRFDTRIAQLEADEHSRDVLAASRAQHSPNGPVYTGGADLVYDRTGTDSYFLDLCRSAMPGHPAAHQANQRLQEHAQMLARVPERDLPGEFRASTRKQPADLGLETRVNPSRIGGQGGYFVPPIWLISDYVAFLRAGRTVANLFEGMDLPGGTDSINLPKLSLGTSTGWQQDNGAVTSQDITDSFATAPVRTLAGQEDIAIQLLDQSPIAFDDVILKDLMSDYNQKLDLGCVGGSGSNGVVKGLSNVAGINSVTFTSGSPTLPLLWPILMQAISQVARQRFRSPNAIVMTPQRWWWIASTLDTQNRPLVLPQAGGGSAVNAIAIDDPEAAEGRAGAIGGVPVYVDANVPSTAGAGSNQDTIYVGYMPDFYLFEGAIRTRALVEVLSGTLQVRVQLYNYVATLMDRYPVTLSAINGTGLVTPAGF